MCSGLFIKVCSPQLYLPTFSARHVSFYIIGPACPSLGNLIRELFQLKVCRGRLLFPAPAEVDCEASVNWSTSEETQPLLFAPEVQPEARISSLLLCAFPAIVRGIWYVGQLRKANMGCVTVSGSRAFFTKFNCITVCYKWSIPSHVSA